MTDLAINDNRWHYLAITWSSNLGEWNIFKDAHLIESGVGLSANQPIQGSLPLRSSYLPEVLSSGWIKLILMYLIPYPGNGIFVLGQEQDFLGGGFSDVESFIGSMSRINLWDQAFREEEILSLMDACGDDVTGNVIAWPDFLRGLHGKLHSVNSSLCQGEWNNLVKLHRTLTTTFFF